MCCIGGPFVLKLMERAPDRVLASVLCQPSGHRPENSDVMYDNIVSCALRGIRKSFEEHTV